MSAPSDRMPPPYLQHKDSTLSQSFTLRTFCVKRSDIAHFPIEGPFEWDIEISLVVDFALSGKLIHTRWFSFLVKRKPDTKTEMKSLTCRIGLHICGWVHVGVSFFFLSHLVFEKMERQIGKKTDG